MAKKRIRKPRGQIWNVYLTLDERLRLRRILQLCECSTTEDIKKNTRALHAIEADDNFSPDPGTSREELEQLNASLNARMLSGEEEAIRLTHENVTCILDSLNSVLKNKKTPQHEEISTTGFLSNLVDAIERLELAKDGKQEPGEVEKDEGTEEVVSSVSEPIG